MAKINAAPIISTRDLCKYYGEVRAVDDLNLDIYPGEIFGLLGPNGAGKTTTTLMLLGLTDPTSGGATIDGKDCTKDSLSVKNVVGYLPDRVGFYPSMTGRDNLIFAGMMNGLDKDAASKRASSLLEKVGLEDAADRHTGTYSRGMLQRLGIADVLMKSPKVIIMDEPTSGIDPKGTMELTELIRKLCDAEGITILISSHDLYQIQKICDRVGLFVKGHMIACGTLKELSAQLMSEGLYLFDFVAEKEGKSIWDTDFQNTIRSIPGVNLVGKKIDGTVHVESNRDIQKELVHLLADNDFTIRELHQEGGDLNDIYRKYFEMEEAKEGGMDDGNGTNGNGTGEKISRKVAGIFKK